MAKKRTKQEEANLVEKEALKRSVFFVPCESKEHLKLWIKQFLDLDFPDAIVCDDEDNAPPTNSSPLDLLWELYSMAITGDENHTKYLVYAAREAYKTLTASVIEVLALFHLRRNVVHVAAIIEQSKKCMEYVKKFLELPIFRDCVSSKNETTIVISWYENSDKTEIYTLSEAQQVGEGALVGFTKKSYQIKIIPATLRATNGQHAPLLVLDELDIAPPKPVEEAMLVPCAGENKEPAIVLMTSSRKTAFGLVQKEIEKLEANPKYQLHVRHWNAVDVTEKCLPARCKSDEGEITIYVNNDDFRYIDESGYEQLMEKEKTKYTPYKGYPGCLNNCCLFAGCKGRLARKQTSKAKLLKTIQSTKYQFSESGISTETIKAQLMCWKPGAVGLIYPYLSKERHMISLNQMAEIATGEQWSIASKEQLYAVLGSLGYSAHLGMDFGYTHNFATVLGWTNGHNVFVTDAFLVSGLELNEKIEICKRKYLRFNPVVYPDPAYPSDIKTFRKNGFNCRHFEKDVLLGIDCVRSKLNPGSNKDPELFFLAGDDEVYSLFKQLLHYHWKVDSQDNQTDEPDKIEDDACDAIRYMMQNLFGKNGSVRLGTPYAAPKEQTDEELAKKVLAEWFSKEVSSLTGDEAQVTIQGKKGKFSFSI